MNHIPVLQADVQKYLDLKQGEIVIDATLGLGGHAEEILKRIGKSGKLIGFETDERNLAEAKKRLKKDVTYIHDNFRYLKNRITAEGEAQRSPQKVSAILFDLGLSSPHVDDPERGFSFQKNGPLDMRFNQKDKLTAADVINTYPEEDLRQIFFEYGEERMARKAAKRICEHRKEKKFKETLEFAEFLENILPKKHSTKMHPATKIFQAIRIEVNDELNALKEALQQSVEVLKIGGRLVVISYHSLEDRIVKQFFKSLQKPPASEEEVIYRTHGDPFIKILTKKPVIPTQQEIAENPRSRSAKLRACEKLKPIPNPIPNATIDPLQRNQI